MPSEADFLNDALIQCGGSIITAIDDGSINANHCARLYPALRAAALRLVDWHFAGGRAFLQQIAVAPAFEFTFAYALPADFIKLREYNGINQTTTSTSLYYGSDVVGMQPYTIEGQTLLTNDGSVAIKYTKDITNPTLWEPLFYQMLSTWLGSKLARAITKDDKKAAELLKEAISLGLPLAAAIDGQQQSIQPYIADDLRYGR